MTEESDRRKLWSPSERARVLSALEKLSYIREAEVPRDALAEVLDKIKLKSLVLGEYVFSQGDHNRGFYIVLSGQMQFCVPANKVRPAALGSSGPATLDRPAHPSPSPLLTAAHLAAHQGAFAHLPSPHARTHMHALPAAVMCGRAPRCWGWRGRAPASGSSASSQASRARWAPARRRTATCSSSTASSSTISSHPCLSARWRAARWVPLGAAGGAAWWWWLRSGGWTLAGVVVLGGPWCGGG